MIRDDKIDFYKGMLMWGVVWGHTITCLLQDALNEVGIHPIFRTYDMPFFMLISGYFLSFSMKKYSFANLIKNKVTTIALPTIFWILLSSKFSRIYPGYYFLWAVFFSSVIMCLINKILTHKILQIMIYALIVIILHCQPYSLENLPYLFPYFVLGYYGYEWLLNSKVKPLYVLPIYILGLCFWRTDYNIWNAGADLIGGGTSLIYAILFRTFIAITGIVVAKGVFDLLYTYLIEKHPSVYFFFINCGKETLALYILHPIILGKFIEKIVINISQHYGHNILTDNHLLLGYVISPLLSCAIMFLMLPFLNWCHRHRYTNILFGFKL